MKLYVLDNGKIIMRSDNPVTQDMSAEASIPVHCFLFETEKGYVLFDTGCDPEGMTKNWPEHLRKNPYVFTPEQRLDAQLRTLGLTYDDVAMVVASHLHLDHAGNLARFRNAKVYVNRQEFQKSLHLFADSDFSGFHTQSDLSACMKAELNWVFVDEEAELPLTEQLTILNFGSGHSFGMLGLLATGTQKRVLLAGDTLYSAANFEDATLLPGIVFDEAGYSRTAERIRKTAQHYGAQVLFGHDPEQYAALKKAPEFYEI